MTDYQILVMHGEVYQNIKYWFQNCLPHKGAMAFYLLLLQHPRKNDTLKVHNVT